MMCVCPTKLKMPIVTWLTSAEAAAQCKWESVPLDCIITGETPGQSYA